MSSKVMTLLAVLSLSLAALVLAGLLMVSTGPGDETLRRLDLSVRQAAEIAPRVVDAALDMTPGAEGRTTVAQGLEALGGRLHRANAAFEALAPARPNLRQRLRAMAVAAFDSLDDRRLAFLGEGDLRAEFTAVNVAAAAFATRGEQFLFAHRDWSRNHAQIVAESRELVGTLRREREDAAADALFSTTDTLLERSRLHLGVSATELAALLAATRDAGAGLPAEHGQRIEDLAEAMALLPAQRRRAEAAADELAGSPLPELLVGLREQVSADMVQRLSTVGDARVVLNVYTALLLFVLVYFGLRLRHSYRALNRSYEQLEDRVVERTRDLARAVDDLKESQVQLVQAEKMSSLGQLVAGVMHEINTPLMYVQSNVQSNVENLEQMFQQMQPAMALAEAVRSRQLDRDGLRGHLTALGRELDPEHFADSIDELRQLSDDSIEGLGQIAELVQSLKDFSRMDRAEEDRFDVREGLEKTLTITRSLHKYGVEVVRDFEPVPAVYCAPSKINQVFINLVNNAIQAMDGSGTLTLRTRAIDDAVVISVEDTGCGIAPEHLDRIMDPFFTTKPVGQGTGLGLSIVRQIVDEHGGRLDVVSDLGVGTTITLSLPIRRAPTMEAA